MATLIVLIVPPLEGAQTTAWEPVDQTTKL